MNPGGPTEHAGKALSTIANAMRAQPLAFGYVVTNIIWIAFFVWFAWTLRDRNNNERRYFTSVIDRCLDLRQQIGPDLFKPPPR